MNENEDTQRSATAEPTRRLVRRLAAVLLLAAALVTAGVSMLSTPAGFIVGGILLAGWALVTLPE